MAIATVYPVSGSGTGWSGPNNITSITDSPVAQYSLAIGATSTALRATFEGAAIPAGSTIQGIQLYARLRRVGTGATEWSRAQFLSSGNNRDPATAFGGTPATYSTGGPSDLWGRGWTPADVNSGLYVDLQVRNTSKTSASTAYVAYVYAEITYVPPPVVQTRGDTLAGSIDDTAEVTPLVSQQTAGDTLTGSIDDWAWPSGAATLGDTLSGSIVDEGLVTGVEAYTAGDTLEGSIDDDVTIRQVYLPGDTLGGEILDELQQALAAAGLGDTLEGAIDDALVSDAGVGVGDVLLGDISDISSVDAVGVAEDTLSGVIIDHALVNATVTAGDTLAGSISDGSQTTIIPLVSEPRIALDVYTLDGVRVGSGPITGVVSARYGSRVDEIGSWSATVPATLLNADQLVRGREVRIRREGEGVVYRGIIERVDITVSADGQRMLAISGPSVAVQLLWANTLLARQYTGTPISTAVSGLLTGTGWALGSVPAGPTVSLRFDGASIWQALREIASTAGRHVVEDPLTRRVDVAEIGADSGLVIRQVEQPHADLAVIPLVALEIRQDERELWNRVIPLGSGQGVNALTLQRSTRSTPYPRLTAIGPDGRPYWYLEDTASVAANGARTRVLKFDDVAPLSNTNAEYIAAANTLYDVAAAWLGYHAAPGEHYAADITMLRHIDPDTGQATFRVGQRVRLQWTGITSDEHGTRLWRSVDAMVYVMGYQREFAPTGASSWSLELSTTDQHAEGAADAMADAIEDLWAVRVGTKSYSYREIHGPYVESVADGTPATFPVRFDGQIAQLHQATLELRKRQVKSNVTAAAAGGGTTSSSGGGGTSSAGGATVSGSGDPHTHQVGGQTAAESGQQHWHQLFDVSETSAWQQQPYQRVIRGKTGPALPDFNFGFFVNSGGSGSGAVLVSMPGSAGHTHAISATTSAAESSHTHNIPGHTHQVPAHTHDIPTHTHALTYGIYLGPAASTPLFRVAINGIDRTFALGGPWNNNVELDITPYLVDAGGFVLRQSNTITVSASQLCDVEMTVRSLVTAQSLVPV